MDLKNGGSCCFRDNGLNYWEYKWIWKCRYRGQSDQRNMSAHIVRFAPLPYSFRSFSISPDLSISFGEFSKTHAVKSGVWTFSNYLIGSLRNHRYIECHLKLICCPVTSPVPVKSWDPLILLSIIAVCKTHLFLLILPVFSGVWNTLYIIRDFSFCWVRCLHICQTFWLFIGIRYKERCREDRRTYFAHLLDRGALSTYLGRSRWLEIQTYPTAPWSLKYLLRVCCRCFTWKSRDSSQKMPSALQLQGLVPQKAWRHPVWI